MLYSLVTKTDRIPKKNANTNRLSSKITKKLQITVLTGPYNHIPNNKWTIDIDLRVLLVETQRERLKG